MLGDDVPPLIEVRGEVYMPLSGFRELNERLVAEGKSRRRTRATQPQARCGRRTRRSPRRPLSIWAYGVGTTRASSSRRTRRRSNGCGRTASPPTRSRSASSRSRRSRGVRRRGSSAHRARLRDRRDRHQGRRSRAAAPLGALHSRPRWARAFKWAPMTRDDAPQQDRVRVGRTGALNPWAMLEPVEVGGVTSRARRCTTRRTSTGRTSARATT